MISKCVFLSRSQALVWTAVISINWRLYSESLVPPPSSRLYLVVSVHTWHWNLCCDCYSVTIMSLVTDPCNVISNGGTRCNYVKLVDLLSQTFLDLSANLSCVHLSCSPRLQFSVSSFVLLLEECSRVVVFLPLLQAAAEFCLLKTSQSLLESWNEFWMMNTNFSFLFGSFKMHRILSIEPGAPLNGVWLQFWGCGWNRMEAGVFVWEGACCVASDFASLCVVLVPIWCRHRNVIILSKYVLLKHHLGADGCSQHTQHSALID